MQPTDDEVDRLLAQGRLGGPGRERVFEQVVAGLDAGERRAKRWSARFGGAALAAAAAALGLVLLVARPASHPAADGFRAKGGEGAGSATLELGCLDASLAACPVGSTLVFAASGPGAGATFAFAAYAEPREGAAAGAGRIWYFSADNEAPPLPASDGTRAAKRGIRIGPEHAPGAYLVHVFLSQRPLTREALLAGRLEGVSARRTFNLTVVAP
jgi:hypothetical protein